MTALLIGPRPSCTCGQEPVRADRPADWCVFVSFHGRPSVLAGEGPAFRYMDDPADWFVDFADGAWLWRGSIRGWRDYWGEYDEELDTGELRALTAEEWELALEEAFDWLPGRDAYFLPEPRPCPVHPERAP